jgi:hypothetical protein
MLHERRLAVQFISTKKLKKKVCASTPYTMISPYGPHPGPPKKKTAPCAAPTPVPCLIPSSHACTKPPPGRRLPCLQRPPQEPHRGGKRGPRFGEEFLTQVGPALPAPRLAPRPAGDQHVPDCTSTSRLWTILLRYRGREYHLRDSSTNGEEVVRDKRGRWGK